MTGEWPLSLMMVIVFVFVSSGCQTGIERLPPEEVFTAGEIRIGVDPSLPPFAALTEDQLFGIDIDIGREIGERVGLPVRFVVMGYDGLYDSLIADDAPVDVVISALLVDPTRTQDVLYTQHYYNAGLVLVSPENTPLRTMEALPGYAVAYEFGSAGDEEIRRWLRRIDSFEVLPYELPQYALDAVRLGVSDAALVDATSARLYLRDYPNWNVGYVYVTHAFYAVAVKNDHVRMWQLVDKALQSMIDDGTLNDILNKWL